MYLAATTITILLGLIVMVSKRVTVHTSNRPLEYTKHTITGEPAVKVSRAYVVLGLIFAMDALRVRVWEGPGFFWAFCVGWLLLGILSSLYLWEFYDD